MTVKLRKHDGRQPWRLHLVGDNGEELATSEGYATKWNAKRAARKNFPGILLLEEPPK